MTPQFIHLVPKDLFNDNTGENAIRLKGYFETSFLGRKHARQIFVNWPMVCEHINKSALIQTFISDIGANRQHSQFFTGNATSHSKLVLTNDNLPHGCGEGWTLVVESRGRIVIQTLFVALARSVTHVSARQTADKVIMELTKWTLVRAEVMDQGATFSLGILVMICEVSGMERFGYILFFDCGSICMKCVLEFRRARTFHR